MRPFPSVAPGFLHQEVLPAPLPSCHPDLGLPHPRGLCSGFCSWVPHHWGLPGAGPGESPLQRQLGWVPRASTLTAGIRTGKCVAFNATMQTCEIFGWCPVEVDDNIPW